MYISCSCCDIMTDDYVLVGEDMGSGSCVSMQGKCTMKHPALPQYCVVCFDREPDRASLEPVSVIQPTCSLCAERLVFYCSLGCLLAENNTRPLCHHCKTMYPTTSRDRDGVGPVSFHFHHSTAPSSTSLGLTSSIIAAVPPRSSSNYPPHCRCNWIQRRMGSSLGKLKCDFCETCTMGK